MLTHDRPDKVDITLGPTDSAIVLHDNGMMDIILSKAKSDDDTASKSAFTAVLLVEFLQDRALVEALSERLVAKTARN